MIVQADASLRGLGVCLIQDRRPIAFASKSLTGVESCYANTERELLTVIFACIWFNTYLQGCSFTVQSDHKPLEVIHLKSMHNMPPCLQRMLLQLQKYDMKIEYKPGSEMLLATVYQLVQHGWLKERRRVPAIAKYYWDFRDELSTDEGLLLKGPSLVIPAVLRELSPLST